MPEEVTGSHRCKAKCQWCDGRCWKTQELHIAQNHTLDHECDKDRRNHRWST